MNTIRLLRQLPGIRRAWPTRDGRIIMEAVDAHRRLRAGEIDVDGTVRWARFATDSGLLSLDPTHHPRLLVHRLGRRAVERRVDRFTKHLRPGQAPVLVKSLAKVNTFTERVGVDSPRTLTFDSHSMDCAVLPGKPIYLLGAQGLAGWRSFALAWPKLVATESTFPTHTAVDESSNLWRWYTLARDFEAIPPDLRIGEQVSQVCRYLVDGDGPLVLAHRDLHDKQLMWDGSQLGILDWDTVARAEASLDLANLRAHADLRQAQGHYSFQLARAILDILDQTAQRMNLSPERFTAYYLAARWRLAFVYAFRPQTRRWLPAWIEATIRLSGLANRSTMFVAAGMG